MGAEKLSGEAGSILVDGEPLIIELAMDSGADVKAGYLVEQTSATEFGANPVQGTAAIKPMGAAEARPETDVDTLFTAADNVSIYLCGSSCIVRSFMDIESSATVYIGQLAIAGSSTSGAWDLAGAMTNSDIRMLCGRVGRTDATVDGSLRIGYLNLSI